MFEAGKAALMLAGKVVKVLLAPNREQKVRCINADCDPYYSDSPHNLKLNDVYTIDHTESEPYISYVYLKEIEGAYNSVRFECMKENNG